MEPKWPGFSAATSNTFIRMVDNRADPTHRKCAAGLATAVGDQKEFGSKGLDNRTSDFEAEKSRHTSLSGRTSPHSISSFNSSTKRKYS
jgi:hypothetical protein